MTIMYEYFVACHITDWLALAPSVVDDIHSGFSLRMWNAELG